MFKGYTDDLKIPSDWDNISYGNDACPSWSVAGLHIFIDHPNPQERESGPDCPRFGVSLLSEYGEGERVFGVDTDDWNEVLRIVEEKKTTWEILFKAFQSTRQKHKDSEPYHPDERIMEGYTYLDTFKDWVGEGLHIEINNGDLDWKYSLTIMNDTWASDDLEELERHLFDFAMSEGYCDDLEKIAAKTHSLN